MLNSDRNRLPILLVMLLALLNLANPTAFSVIISLSTFGLYQSYFIAIMCMFLARISGRFDEVSRHGSLSATVHSQAGQYRKGETHGCGLREVSSDC